MNTTNKRERWVDIAKGFAILLVVLGHAIRDDMRVDFNAWDVIYRSCYVFHMSFFIWLSGYTYEIGCDKNHQNAGLFFKKKFERLIFPWILYTAFIFIVFRAAMFIPKVYKILNGAGYEKISFPKYIWLCLQARNPWSVHLWFIYILFLITVLVFLFESISFKHNKLMVIVLMLLCLSMAFVLKLYNFGLFHKVINYVVLYTPFFVLGKLYYWFKNKNNLNTTLTKKILITIWGILAVIYIIYRVYNYSSFSGNSIVADSLAEKMIVYYLAYLLLPGLMIFLSMIFEKSHSVIEEKTHSFFEYIGGYSFDIYLFHQPFFCAFLALILYGKLGLPSIISIIICSFCSIVFSIFIKKIICTISKKIKK